MRTVLLFIVGVGLSILICLNVADGRFPPTLGNYTSHVDTRIGTGGYGYGLGQVNPGPQVPFGAMRLGPDTSLGLEPFRIPFDQYGGYYYHNDFIECFSHTHLDGAGLGDFQNFGVMVARQWNNHIITDNWYRTTYDHKSEVAVPGYYAVELPKIQTTAELSVSGTHSGIHRYTCNASNAKEGEPCVLLIDVCHSAAVGKPLAEPGSGCYKAQITNASLSSQDELIVSAWMLDHGSLSGKGIKMYFRAVVTATVLSTGSALTPTAQGWINNTASASVSYNVTMSKSLGVGVTFGEKAGETVVMTVRSGLSFMSAENAEAMLPQQQVGADGKWLSFSEVQQKATGAWESLLGNVDVLKSTSGLPDSNLKVFYSALYRSHLAPTTYTEFGTYLGEDNKVHAVPDVQTNFMSDLSIWDIYRSQMPLLMITSPRTLRNTVWSMMEMYKESGRQLPKWVLFNQEDGVMVGHHSAIIMSDAIRKGIQQLDVDAIFKAVVHGVRGETKKMSPLGYLPYTGGYGDGSKTLDYAVDAGAVVELAKYLNNQSVVEEFQPFADAFANVWDSETLLFCPKYANGTFQCPTEPTMPYPFDVNYYTEGNAVEYRWYVPHSLGKLVDLFPSPQVYAQKLNDFFADSVGWFLGTTLPNPQFWAGNEPDILAPVLFPYAGNSFAWLTSKWFPKMLWQYSTTRPSGLPGNDDYGTLSAWTVFGYLGIYPVSSTNDFVLFAPQFERAEVSISADGIPYSGWHGAQEGTPIITITAHNHPGPGKPAYLANASVNGRPLSTPIVSQDTLVSGSQGNMTSRIDLYLVSEPVVFGSPLPSQGGPQPFMPEPGVTKASAAKAKAKQFSEAELTTMIKMLLSRGLKRNK